MKPGHLLGYLALTTLLGAQTGGDPVLRYTATPANVSGPREPIRIDLFRWSTHAERDRLLAGARPYTRIAETA